MSKLDLAKTLDFGLGIHTGDTCVLDDATTKARTVYNKVIHRYFNTKDSYKEIRKELTNETDLVQNSVQIIVDKAYKAIKQYYDNEEHGRPEQKDDDYYPLLSNHGRGYELSVGEDDEVSFRISTVPHSQKVRGTLEGRDEDISLVKHALQPNSEWKVGTSEVVQKNGEWRLHVDITHEEATINDPEEARTLIGVDVNEGNVALVALKEDKGVVDSLVLEYPEIKNYRHAFFVMRKRARRADKPSVLTQLGNKEERFVTDATHKVSRRVVEWAQKFENPCVILEDLKDMRDSIEYGARMNRRLHALPFGKLQRYITYKAGFDGIPVVKADPAYTSQECLNCGHTAKANRQGGRFSCVDCEWQDHSDRKAGVSIAERGIAEIGLGWTVPPLNRLPVVRTESCDGLASGRMERPTTTQAFV